MTQDKLFDPDIQLELKDRINYTNILTVTLLAIKRTLLKPDFVLDDLENAIIDFFTDIPNAWYDTQFIKDMKNVVEYKEVEYFGEFAGVPLNEETAKEIGTYRKETTANINYFKLKNNIINLLHRRNLLIRKEKIEYTDGVNIEIETIDDLAEYEETEYDEETEKEIKKIIESEKDE
jgi:hypothetical protein